MVCLTAMCKRLGRSDLYNTSEGAVSVMKNVFGMMMLFVLMNDIILCDLTSSHHSSRF